MPIKIELCPQYNQKTDFQLCTLHRAHALAGCEQNSSKVEFGALGAGIGVHHVDAPVDRSVNSYPPFFCFFFCFLSHTVSVYLNERR